MLYTTIESAAAPLLAHINAAHHILVTSHINPDGDAVGSVVGMSRVLENMGKTVSMIVPTPLPAVAHALPDANNIQIYVHNRNLPADVDLIVLLDTGSVARIEPISTHEQAYLQARPLIVIDHHVTNNGEGAVNLIMTKAAATCEILTQLFQAWNVTLDSDTATALLLGMLTDTQSFQTSQTTPQTMRVAADLVELGGRLNPLVRAMLFNNKFANAKALAAVVAGMQQEGEIIWAQFTQAIQRETGASDEAGDDITAFLSRIGGAKVYVLLKERRDGSVKLSLRSAPGIDVGSVAQALGGGGHREAAGATLEMPLDQARETVLAKVREMIFRR